MKMFARGLLVGLACAGLFAVGYSYAQEDRAADRGAKAYCEVSVGYGSPTSRDKCFYGEVMTGVQGDMILCSRISVTCPD